MFRCGGSRPARRASFTLLKPVVPTVDRVQGEDAAGAADVRLGERERAVLTALVEHQGRVVDRERLRRVAGLAELSERRCDSVVTGIRRALGEDAVLTVRRRGWRLNPEVLAVAMALVASIG
jgi:DNA-binding winged helix-turn-helix (wHTH) protein